MSVIAGIFHRDGSPVQGEVLHQMMGPAADLVVDGCDSWLNGEVGLAHGHFWVTPEEQGELQPIPDRYGTAVITCHARLDNRPELLRLLGIKEPAAKPISDASLILEAYRKWGTHCPKYLLGDFAIVIWDRAGQQLFVARDPMGTGSLCTFLDHKKCLVASRVGQVLAHPEVEPRLNEGKVAELLAQLWHNQEETYYLGIQNLPPAHCALITRHHARVWRYWDIDPGAKIHYRSDDQYAQHFYELLQQAVRCRLRVQGKAGLSLSGGLDSTSLAAVASTLLSTNSAPQTSLSSFSYVFDQYPECDERTYIQPVVDAFNIESHFIKGDNQLPTLDVDHWPSSPEIPIQNPFIFLPLSLLESAREQGCRVMLSGLFGDSLFSGSEYWFLDFLYSLKFAQMAAYFTQYRQSIHWWRYFRNYAIRPLVPQPLRWFYRKIIEPSPEYAHPGLHPNLVKRTGLLDRKNQGFQAPQFSRPGRSARYHAVFGNYIPESIGYGYQMANPYGIEYAYPYYDQRLVSFMMSIPADQLGRPDYSRWIVRNAMEGALPDRVRLRQDKTDFSGLFNEVVFHRGKEKIQELMQRPLVSERSFVKKDWLETKINQLDHLPVGDYNLWNSITLELWLQKYWQS